MASLNVQTSYATAPSQGYAGTLASGDHDVITMKNVEASASIPFGKAVIFKAGGSTDMDALLPSVETDKVAGIVIRSHAYEKSWTDNDGNTYGGLDATGVRTGQLLNVLRRGRILVTAATAVVPGSRLWVRAVAGVGETLGALEDADDSTDMIDCTKQGVWMSTADVGGLAWLEVDFITAP
jgi:hypothetical protein